MSEQDIHEDEKTQSKIVSSEPPAKKPPPESPGGIRLRTFVICSFWAVVVLLGLPVWIRTTSIHRARLPLQDMLGWADGRACKLTFPLQITVEAPFLKDTEAAHLVQLTQHALDDLNDFSAHHLRLHLASYRSPLSEDDTLVPQSQDTYEAKRPRSSSAQNGSALTIRLLAQSNAHATQSELQPHSAILNIIYAPNQVPSTSSSSSALATLIATKLQELFAEEQAIIAYILSQSTPNTYQSTGQISPVSQPSSSASKDLRSHSSGPPGSELAARVSSSMMRSLKYAPTYHITISLFTPSALPSSWEVETAIAEYFTPLLNSLSVISKFTVDTQVQLFATLSPSVQAPKYDAHLDTWTLREEDLSGFINAAEWPLSPSIGSGPTLNFVLYVPDQATTPLVVEGSQASSWLIPQWGGVVILNHRDLNVSREMLSKEAIRPALLTFSHQLLSFLGAPQTPPSLPLQLQTLTRIRAASLFLSASSTMGSLANLTVALSSIAIPETVSNAVVTTLSRLRCTCTALKDGRFKNALENARIAEAEAERGFFEKSMVGQVYFPDEHKVAVYLPLLGPIGVPLVMSALKEVRSIWRRKKATELMSR